MEDPRPALFIQAPQKPRAEPPRRLRGRLLGDEFQSLCQHRPIPGIKPAIWASLHVLTISRGEAGLTLLFKQLLNPPTTHKLLHFSGSASNPRACVCERDVAALSLY